MTSYYNIMKEIESGSMKVIDKTRDDMVNDPPHYNTGSIECIDAIQAALTPTEFRGYCKGNNLKYTWREHYKGEDEDLKKAAWYLDRLLQSIDDDES
jgi:hypothetical protein|tara:strand:+ start:432 stop:722 length:291 start_codon:yes stop_codon:yes gene_type:complete